jgi:pyruvate dehydrogenase E2 component (dihydrolipoamide acetyltransferase)
VDKENEVTEIRVPDIGSDSADVIEILVKPGDRLTPEQAIMVLESDKASMEVPVPQGGVVRTIAVKGRRQRQAGRSVAATG